MNCHQKSFVLLATFCSVGCASSSGTATLPSPATAPDGTPETPQALPHRLTSWRITPTSQSQAYSSVLTTVITEAGAPAARRDSLTTQVSYSIGATAIADNVSFSGIVTSFSTSGSSPEASELPLTLPFSFSGQWNNHEITFQRLNSAAGVNSCADLSQTPLSVVQRNLILLPLELVDQQTWTDSTSLSVCSGILPLNLTTIRSFHVAGESEINGVPVLMIDQNERTFSKGEGSQGQHRIIVESQGTSTGRFYLDRQSGQLLTANLTSKASVSIQSSGRIQHFQQNSTTVTQRAR